MSTKLSINVFSSLGRKTNFLNTKRTVSFLLAVLLLVPPFVPFWVNGEEGSDNDGGSFFDEVSDFDGSLNIMQQITVPPGRNGLQPNLVLSYSSNDRDIDNIFGYGWSINIPTITRINKTGVDNLYNEEYYNSNLDGELVSMGGGVYRPRTELGNSHVYTLINDVWTLTDKFGVTHIFGSTTSSRQDNPSDSSEIYKWLIDETTDSNDNKIYYSYFKEDGAIYPDEITYNQDEHFAVDFILSTTSAASTTYPGFSVKAGYKIDLIVTKVGGEKVREYLLTKSDRRLMGITETGYIGSSSVSLPPRNFIYAHDTGSTTWSYDPSYDSSLENDFYDGTRFGDVNGDGLADVIVSWWDESWGPDHQRHVHANNGSGWDSGGGGFGIPEAKAAAFWNNDDAKFEGGDLLDVNGDGMIDYVYKKSTGDMEFYVNDGTTFNYDSRWDTTFSAGRENAYKFADVNGDGLPDRILSAITTGSQHTRDIDLNTGSGWTDHGGFNIPDDFGLAFWSTISGELKDGNVADINGDGLVDFIKFTSTDDVKFYINNGITWEYDSSWDVSHPYAFVHGTKFYDVNGDGLNDLVTAYYDTSWGPDFQRHIKLNTGSGWSNGGMTIPYEEDLAFWNENNSQPDTGAIVDVNGDGLPDFVNMAQSDEIRVFINGLGSSKGKITEVSNSFGASTTYSYEAAGVNDSSNKGQQPLQVVKTIVRNDNNGIVGTTTYKYKNADFWFGSTTDKRFAGFGEVTETNDAGNLEIKKFHQANGTSTSELGDSVYAFLGLEYEKTVMDAVDDVWRTQRTNYAVTGTTSTSTKIQVSSVLTRHYDGTASPLDVAIAYSYDSNGNLTAKTEYGKVTGAADGTFTDIGSDDRETTYTYTTPLVGYVASEVLENDSGTKVKERKYYYDDLTHGSSTVGNLTKREDWVTGTTYVGTEWDYNNYGLPTKQTDPRGNETDYTYDAYNLYVATTTDEKSHTVAQTYDYSSGKVSTTTDANGNVSAVAYDPLDRLKTEWMTDNNSSSIVKKTEYEYTDTVGAVRVKRTDHIDDSVSRDTYSYFDGFGRLIQERAEAEGSNYTVRDYVYDDSGLLLKESLPYFDTGTAKSNATTDAKLYTEYTYDPMDRVTSASTTVGTTLTDHDRLVETVTDALGNDKVFEYDGLGRLLDVTEENGTSTYVTEYEYDANDNLTKITDADDNVRNITYDGLFRRTKLEDLHDTADSTFGSTTFSYDAADNLATSTSPNGDVVTWSYDVLNRMLTEDYIGQAGTETSYTYDSCTNGKGQLCTAVNTGVTTNYTYTANGLVADETKTINGTAYTTEYEYTRQGKKSLIIYPDDSEVRFTYNTAGEIEKIEQRESGGSFGDLISDFDYGPHGQITLQVFGNGATTTRTYDADELYRLRSIVTIATTSGGVGGAGEEHALIEAELSGFVLGDKEVEDLDVIEENLAETVSDESYETAEFIDGAQIEDINPEQLDQEENIKAEHLNSEEQTTDHLPSNESENAGGVVSDEGVLFEGNNQASDLPLMSTTTDTNKDLMADVEFGVVITGDQSTIKSSSTSSTKEVEIVTSDTTVVYMVESSTLKFNKNVEYPTDNLVKNEHQARAWRNYHRGRIAYIEAQTDLPPRILEQARHGQEQYEQYLLNKGYISEPGSEIKPLSLSFIHDIGEWFKSIAAYLLPEKALAYLFGNEDFEDCGSVLCSFDDYNYWGSVTGSLDTTSKVNATTSLKEVISGSGGWWEESNGHNTDEIWAQFKIWIPDPMSYGASGYVGIFNSRDTGDDSAVWINLEDLGSPRLTIAGENLSWTNTGIDLIEGEVNTIEIRIKKGTSAGDVDIWLDNNTEGSPDYNGSGSMNLTSSNIDDLEFGVFYSPENGVSTTYFDDVIVSDSFIGLASSSSTVNATPTAPTLLETEGQTNPTNVTDNTPEFTAIYNDPDAGDKAIYYEIEVDDDSGFGSTIWDSGKTSLSTTTAGNRIANISYNGSSLASSTTYYWRIKFWDDENYEGAWSTTTATLSLASGSSGGGGSTTTFGHTSIGASSGNTLNRVGSKFTTGSEGGTLTKITAYTKAVSGTTDIIAALYSDDSGAPADLLAIQSATTTGIGTTASWVDVDMNTYTLQPNTAYWIWYGADASHTVYWDAGSTNQYNIQGMTYPNWSDPITPGSYFARQLSLYATYLTDGGSSSSTPTSSPIYSDLVQNLAYTYDSVGNITKIVDQSKTLTAATTTYVYDDLYRLLTASTSQSSSSPFSDNYSYNSIGNITNFDGTSYTYAETDYANPHAVTSVGEVTYSYDANGNVASSSDGTMYSWNYKNQLTQAGNGSTTTIYGYDHGGSRVKKVAVDEGGSTTTTHYISGVYESENGSSTKHIYSGESLVATIEGSGSGALTYFAHLDHLGSTNAMTNGIGYIVQEIAYYPFGDSRIDNQYGQLDELHRFTGHKLDKETDLTYMGARYYAGDTGRFTSPDPVSLALGDWKTVQDKTDGQIDLYLRNPQTQNSYSYTANNPLKFVDKNGEFIQFAVIPYILSAFGAAMTAIDVYEFDLVHRQYPDQFTQQEKDSAKFQLGFDALTLGAGQTLKAGEKVGFETLTTSLDVMDHYFGEQIFEDRNQSLDTNSNQTNNQSYQSVSPAYIGTGNYNSNQQGSISQTLQQISSALREISRKLNKEED